MPFKEYYMFSPNKLGSRVIKPLVQKAFSLYICAFKKGSKLYFQLFFIFLFFKSGAAQEEDFIHNQFFYVPG
jgi:hypothetical protein